jgi:predicted kinase
MKKILSISIILLSLAYQNVCKSNNNKPNDIDFGELYEKHYSTLHNLHIPHKPFVICFSGTPGMGKSYIAKILETKYKAVRINTDDIRVFIRSLYTNLDNNEKEPLLNNYLIYFMKHYKHQNQLIILDASIDRRYNLIFSLCEKFSIPYVIIRLEVPYNEVVERITEREGGDKKHYLPHLPKWYEDYEEFGKTHHCHYLLNNTIKNAPIPEELFAMLERNIK